MKISNESDKVRTIVGKKKEKQYSENQNLNFEITKLKPETADIVHLQKNLNDCQQKCATQEDQVKEGKSKLRNWSKPFIGRKNTKILKQNMKNN